MIDRRRVDGWIGGAGLALATYPFVALAAALGSLVGGILTRLSGDDGTGLVLGAIAGAVGGSIATAKCLHHALSPAPPVGRIAAVPLLGFAGALGTLFSPVRSLVVPDWLAAAFCALGIMLVAGALLLDGWRARDPDEPPPES